MRTILTVSSSACGHVSSGLGYWSKTWYGLSSTGPMASSLSSGRTSLEAKRSCANSRPWRKQRLSEVALDDDDNNSKINNNNNSGYDDEKL